MRNLLVIILIFSVGCAKEKTGIKEASLYLKIQILRLPGC